MKKILALTGLLALLFFAASVTGQDRKVVNHQQQVWTSLNNSIRLPGGWRGILDFHMRRNEFISEPGFYLLRAGVGYELAEDLVVSAGLGHTWLASGVADEFLFANENNIYQQVQYTSQLGWARQGHRLRNEQRWNQQLVSGKKSDTWFFSDRIRYQVSLTVPFSSSEKYPSLVLSDELLIQFGKHVVYNTFDQNRVFAGIRQRLWRDLSFDAGYMLGYQQKRNGYQYDMNHTLRCFFYYSPELKPAGRHKREKPAVTGS